MTVSCPSYVDTHVDWASAVSAEAPHRVQIMHVPPGGSAVAADTPCGRKRKWPKLGYSK